MTEEQAQPGVKVGTTDPDYFTIPAGAVGTIAGPPYEINGERWLTIRWMHPAGEGRYFVGGANITRGDLDKLYIVAAG
jgi:hypothetical protein